MSELQVLAGAATILDRPTLLKGFATFARRIPGSGSRAEALVVSGILRDALSRLRSALGIVDSPAWLVEEVDARRFAAAISELRRSVSGASSDAARFEAILARRYADPDLTQASVAREMEVSVWHLARTLRRETGHRFAWHIRRTRIARAEQLLQKSALSIKEIAARVGYGSVSALDRHFRTTHATTPSQYRGLGKRRR